MQGNVGQCIKTESVVTGQRASVLLKSESVVTGQRASVLLKSESVVTGQCASVLLKSESVTIGQCTVFLAEQCRTVDGKLAVDGSGVSSGKGLSLADSAPSNRFLPDHDLCCQMQRHPLIFSHSPSLHV